MDIAIEDNKIVTKVEYDVHVKGEEKALRQIAFLEKKLKGIQSSIKMDSMSQAKAIANTERSIANAESRYRTMNKRANFIRSKSSRNASMRDYNYSNDVRRNLVGGREDVETRYSDKMRAIYEKNKVRAMKEYTGVYHSINSIRGFDRNLIGSNKNFRPELFNQNSIASRSTAYGAYRQPTPLMTRPNSNFGRNTYSGVFDTATGSFYLKRKELMDSIKTLWSKKGSSGKGGVASRNNLGGLDGLVGKAMLYMGFASLGAYAVSSVGRAMYGAGTMAGDVELDMLKGRALDSIYGSSAIGAVNRYSALTGNKDYMSKSILAQVASPLEASGKRLSSTDLTKVSEILYGMEYGLGKTRQTSVDALSNVLAGKTTLKEAGFANVQKGSNEAETLNNIYTFLKKNQLTSGIMQDRTMKAIMNEITTSPTNIFSNLMSTSSKQMKRTFGDIADEMNKMFGGKGASSGQQGMWGSVLGQFEYSVAGALKEHGPDITKGLTDLAVGLSWFAGESIRVMGLMSRYLNPERLASLLGIYAGVKTGAIKGGAKFITKNPIVAPIAFATALGVNQHKEILDGKYDWKELMDEDLRRSGYSSYPSGGNIQNGAYQINATNVYLNKDGIETDTYINEQLFGEAGGLY